MAERYKVSITDCSYLTTAQIGIMGIAPLLWIPLMNIYGRTPLLMIAALGCAVANIGGAYCSTYGQQMGTRVICALFLSAGGTLGGAFTGSMYFQHERGRKNGLWSCANILGSPGGPLFMGFVVQHAGIKWVFWVFAGFNFMQLIGWTLCDEILYNPERPANLKGVRRYLHIYNVAGEPFRFKSVLAPLKHIKNHKILLAGLASAFTFTYGNIVFIVETPSIFSQLFHFDAQTIALQYIPIIIGSLIGEVFGGALSDIWMIRSTARRGFRHPADRLWFTYPASLLTIVGLMIWGVFLYKADVGHWTVRPLIGSGICACGADIICTVLTTYSIDCLPHDATNIVLLIIFIRLMWGFISPFYFPKMFTALNYAGSAGFMSGVLLMFAISILVLHVMENRKIHKAAV